MKSETFVLTTNQNRYLRLEEVAPFAIFVTTTDNTDKATGFDSMEMAIEFALEMTHSFGDYTYQFESLADHPHSVSKITQLTHVESVGNISNRNPVNVL